MEKKKPKTSFCRAAFVAVECETGVTAEPAHKREVWNGGGRWSWGWGVDANRLKRHLTTGEVRGRQTKKDELTSHQNTTADTGGGV